MCAPPRREQRFDPWSIHDADFIFPAAAAGVFCHVWRKPAGEREQRHRGIRLGAGVFGRRDSGRCDVAECGALAQPGRAWQSLGARHGTGCHLLQ